MLGGAGREAGRLAFGRGKEEHCKLGGAFHGGASDASFMSFEASWDCQRLPWLPSSGWHGRRGVAKDTPGKNLQIG